MIGILEAQRADVSANEVRFARVAIGGLPVAALDRAATADLTIRAALARRGTNQPCLFFTTVNGQVVSLCASRPDIKTLFYQADLISADGMSVVFASRLGSPVRLPERVATTDAFHDAARLARDADASFFFLGATEDVNVRSVTKARELYPGLRIVGRRNGYFQRHEESQIVDLINKAAPDILWVGLGVPQQQQFVLANRHRLTNVGVAKSCGGLFDFLAGRAKRAPHHMQMMGLEWLYRVWLEPKRLAWRYLTTNPHALYLLLLVPGQDVPHGAIKMDGAYRTW